MQREPNRERRSEGDPLLDHILSAQAEAIYRQSRQDALNAASTERRVEERRRPSDRRAPFDNTPLPFERRWGERRRATDRRG